MNISVPGYEVIQELGEGGMCVVYLAKHKAFGNSVAIKVLHEIFSRREDMRKRFLNEARIMHGLNHENIVKVRDFIELEGRVALVMEYVEGKTLDHIIGREIGPITHEKALPLFSQILDAVEYAHSSGVVHRDLKPSNIIVTKNGTAKVTDFGIAKVMGSAGMTRTGTKLGTLYYMSPEQIRGARDVNSRTDIYSLGMTLYEMLAGRLPFEIGENTTEFEITQKIVFEEHDPPSVHYPHIPLRIAHCVQMAIHKEPDSRYQSCQEFRKALELSDTNKGTELDRSAHRPEEYKASAFPVNLTENDSNEFEEAIYEIGDLEVYLGPGPLVWTEAFEWVNSLDDFWRMPTMRDLQDLDSLLKDVEEQDIAKRMHFLVWSAEARDYQSYGAHELVQNKSYWLNPEEGESARAIAIRVAGKGKTVYGK